MKTLEELKAEGEAPEWLSNDAFQMLQSGIVTGKQIGRAHV